MKTNLPKRCAISLDIVNMFNKVSREKAMRMMENHFSPITNVAELLLEGYHEHLKLI